MGCEGYIIFGISKNNFEFTKLNKIFGGMIYLFLYLSPMREERIIHYKELNAIGKKCKTISYNWLTDIFPTIVQKYGVSEYPGITMDKVKQLMYKTYNNEKLKNIFLEIATGYYEKNKKTLIANLKRDIEQKRLMLEEISKPYVYIPTPGEAA